jgi:hypothetical protein
VREDWFYAAEIVNIAQVHSGAAQIAIKHLTAPQSIAQIAAHNCAPVVHANDSSIYRLMIQHPTLGISPKPMIQLP